MPLNTDIQSYIADASARFGVSQSYLSNTALYESGGNPAAAGGGLFQFHSAAAAQYGLSNVLDPQASTNAAAQMAATNQSIWSRAFGSNPNDTQLYLMHQQGPSGAINIFNNLQAPASQVVQNFKGNIGPDFSSITGVHPDNATAQNFVDYTAAKFNGQTGGVTVSVPPTGGTAASQTTVDTSTWMGWLEHQAVRGAVFTIGAMLFLAGLGILAIGQLPMGRIAEGAAAGYVGGKVGGAAVAKAQTPAAPAAPPPPPAPEVPNMPPPTGGGGVAARRTPKPKPPAGGAGGPTLPGEVFIKAPGGREQKMKNVLKDQNKKPRKTKKQKEQDEIDRLINEANRDVEDIKNKAKFDEPPPMTRDEAEEYAKKILGAWWKKEPEWKGPKPPKGEPGSRSPMKGRGKGKEPDELSKWMKSNRKPKK